MTAKVDVVRPAHALTSSFRCQLQIVIPATCPHVVIPLPAQLVIPAHALNVVIPAHALTLSLQRRPSRRHSGECRNPVKQGVAGACPGMS